MKLSWSTKQIALHAAIAAMAIEIKIEISVNFTKKSCNRTYVDASGTAARIITNKFQIPEQNFEYERTAVEKPIFFN